MDQQAYIFNHAVDVYNSTIRYLGVLRITTDVTTAESEAARSTCTTQLESELCRRIP